MKSRKLFKVCALLMLAVMSCLLFSGAAVSLSKRNL